MMEYNEQINYVIARYEEDISWTNKLNSKFFIVEKNIHLPNIGREASSYIWYIINYYDTLEGNYLFCQGDYKPHKISIFDYSCDWEGKPHHHNILRIKEFADKINIEIPEILEFTAGAQFEVSAEQIKQKSIEWYKSLYESLYLR